MTARKRLLLTVDAVGGVWQYALDLARGLAPKGYETVLALFGPDPSAAQADDVTTIPDARLVRTGRTLDWLARDAGEVAAAGQALADLARSSGADIVQVNHPALIAGADLPVPTIAVAHSCMATWWAAVEGTPLPADFAWRADLHGAGLRRAARVVAPSAAFAAATAAAYDLPTVPAVVHNGRTPFACPAGAIHDFAITAGRLWDRGKNLATLDRAAARLGVPVKAAGSTEGPNGETVAFEHLHAMGQVSDATLAGCFCARPVFVSTARYEPFGLAVLEAALAGCPLVLSDIPTFRELWDGAAVFVAPDDDAGFAQAIESIIGDTHARLAAGERARAVARGFTPRRMAAGMDTLFHGLVPAAKAAA